MNAAISKNVMQVVDWDRFDLEGWLYQFGAWIDHESFIGAPGGGYKNPIAQAMAGYVASKKRVSLTPEQRQSVMVGYFTDPKRLRVGRNNVVCKITDTEARAVQRLVLDLMGTSEILDDWLDAVIDRYFRGCSWKQMVRTDRTEMDAKFDVRTGLAALHVRYPHIKMVKNHA